MAKIFVSFLKMKHSWNSSGTQVHINPDDTGECLLIVSHLCKNILQFLNWSWSSRIYSEWWTSTETTIRILSSKTNELPSASGKKKECIPWVPICAFDPRLPYLVHDFSGCKITQGIFKGKDATNTHYQYIVLCRVLLLSSVQIKIEIQNS